MSKIPGLDDLKSQSKRLKDIAGHLDKLSEKASTYRDKIRETTDAVSSLDAQFANLNTQMSKGPITQDQLDKMETMVSDMQKLKDKSAIAGKSIEKFLLGSIDKLGKSILKVNFAIFQAGVEGIIDTIQRVYDLQERWIKVNGELNKKIGVLSPTMGKFRKEASQAEAAIRGLGGELGDGTKLFGDLTLAFGKMDMDGFGKLGVQVAEGFGLGTEAAGKFLRTLSNMGFKEQDGEASRLMKSIVSGAQAAGVSVNDLAKDISESRDFMAQFGKAGAKSFISATSYMKKFGISIKQVQSFMNKFDTFDDAAQNVAKLNTVFGTSINAMDMMMEQNPAKRFDMVRKSLLQNGKTFESLSRSEKQYMAQTLGLSESELAATLEAEKAGISYEQHMENMAKTEKKNADAKALMQKMFNATAKTLYNFGAAMDRITKAMGHAIQPFLKMLGLAGDGKKKFTSFGQVMESITKRIVTFFDELAKNPDWVALMEKAAGVVKKVAKAVSDWLDPKTLGKRIEELVGYFKTFLTISKAIMGVWAASKLYSGGKAIFEIASGLKTIAGLGSKLSGMSKTFQAFQAAGVGSGGQLSATQQWMASSKAMMAGPSAASTAIPKASGISALSGIAKLAGGAGTGLLAGSGASSIIEALGGAKRSKTGTAMSATGGALGMHLGGPALAAALGAGGQAWGDLAQYIGDEYFSGESTDVVQKRVEQEKLLETRERTLNSLYEKHAVVSKDLQESFGKLKAKIDAEVIARTKAADASLEVARNKFNKTSEKDTADVDKAQKAFAAAKSTDVAAAIGTTFEQAMRIAAKRGDLDTKKSLEDTLKSVEENNKFLSKERKEQFALDIVTKQETAKLKAKRIADAESAYTEALARQAKHNGDMIDLEKDHEDKIYKIKLEAAIKETDEFVQAKLAATKKNPFDEAAFIKSKMSEPAMAEGGIVTSRTHALIGEAGPEAVIPLKSLASVVSRLPDQVSQIRSQSQVSADQKNYARGKKEDSNVKLVAGDVYLDGKMVGRHLLRSLVTDGRQ